MDEDESMVLGNVRKPLESPREEDSHNKKRKADRSEEKLYTRFFRGSH